MARLSAGTRREMPKSEFAGPDRSYPVPDAAHAKLAKAMAAKYAPPAERARIDAKADAKLRGK